VNNVLEVPAPGHRTLEVLLGGDPAGLPLLFHSGSPSAVVEHPLLEEAAVAAGLRLIMLSRAGYGGSSPRPLPERGPLMVHDLPDIVAVLDHLAVHQFVTLGWAGGGPRALLCAARLGTRCLAAATVASIAPVDAPGLDWVAGMVPESVVELAAAAQGARAYEAHLARLFAPYLEADAETVTASLMGVVDPVDRPMITLEYAGYLARCFRRAAIQGVRGARDDGLAVLSRWGFEVDEVEAPVAVWHGGRDATVPYAHGAWLATHVPGAHGHLLPEDGHLTMLGRLEEILLDLRELAAARLAGGTDPQPSAASSPAT